MSASLSAERRKARPSLPGAPPKKSKSKKPSKPFVVASGVVSGVRTTAISGGTMFTASADAPLQWKGEWHFNNRVNHKHAFTYRTVGGTDLRAAAESCDLAWETVEPPATPSSKPRRPDSPAHSVQQLPADVTGKFLSHELCPEHARMPLAVAPGIVASHAFTRGSVSPNSPLRNPYVLIKK